MHTGFMMITENSVFKTQLQNLRFYGDEFVFNTVSGLCYRLNSTAGFLLRSLANGTGIEQLADLMQTRYDIDRATAMRDIELLLNDIAELGVLDSTQPILNNMSGINQGS